MKIEFLFIKFIVYVMGVYIMAKLDKKLADLIANENNPEKIAQIVMSYNRTKAKEKDRISKRKSFIKDYLKTADGKITLSNLDAIAYEFAYANAKDFKDWLVTHKPELFITKKKEEKPKEDESENGSREYSDENS